MSGVENKMHLCSSPKTLHVTQVHSWVSSYGGEMASDSDDAVSVASSAASEQNPLTATAPGMPRSRRWGKLQALSKGAQQKRGVPAPTAAMSLSACPPVRRALHPWTVHELGTLAQCRSLILSELCGGSAAAALGNSIVGEENDFELFAADKNLLAALTSVERRRLAVEEEKLRAREAEERAHAAHVAMPLDERVLLQRTRERRADALLALLRGRSFGFAAIVQALRAPHFSHGDLAEVMHRDCMQRKALTELWEATGGLHIGTNAGHGTHNRTAGYHAGMAAHELDGGRHARAQAATKHAELVAQASKSAATVRAERHASAKAAKASEEDAELRAHRRGAGPKLSRREAAAAAAAAAEGLPRSPTRSRLLAAETATPLGKGGWLEARGWGTTDTMLSPALQNAEDEEWAALVHQREMALTAKREEQLAAVSSTPKKKHDQKRNPQVLYIPAHPRTRREKALWAEIREAQNPMPLEPPHVVAERAAARQEAADRAAEERRKQRRTPAERAEEEKLLSWFGTVCKEVDVPGGSINVACHAVVRLALPRNGLVGALPSAFGAALPHLTAIDLSANRLVGPLPETLSTCTLLQTLRLGGNRFEGAVPAAWGTLHCLRELSLERNRLEGDVGTALWPALQYMKGLVTLDVGANGFSGTLPAGLATACPRLRMLRAGSNRLSGPLPPVLGALKELVALELQGNGGLCGPIPETLCECELLETLCLNGNALTGEIPWGICFYLTKLRQLFLAGNRLSGAVPDSIGQLCNLEALNLGRNCLSGEIPADALAHCSRLRSLCLHPNDFALSERALVDVGTRLRAVFGAQLSFLLPKAVDTAVQITESHALLHTRSPLARSRSPSPTKQLGGGFGSRAAAASPPPLIGLMG